jgi:hypothetical protein
MTIQHHPQERSADSRPLTYNDAQSAYQSSHIAARDRYAELSDRDLCSRSVALLRERGELNPQNPGHQSLAEREPLSAADHLEHMALGEVLARHYRHPAMLDHAAKAGAGSGPAGRARSRRSGAVSCRVVWLTARLISGGYARCPSLDPVH